MLATGGALLPLALDNGLGKKPGLGWNSDYCTNCSHGSNGFQNEAFIKHIADSMVSMGFAKLGFTNVNMDASWDTPTRDENGDLTPDPALWPSGIDATIKYVHDTGLGFGLYGDKGDKDCAKNPGQLGHEEQDAKWLAKHEVDWFKEDSCYSPQGESREDQIAAYAKMRDAINATGRHMWFALCGWQTWCAQRGPNLQPPGQDVRRRAGSGE